MYWRMAGFSPPSPIDSILDKETFTLEELFDEEDIIQECRAVNSRLINFLCAKEQMRQMLCYIVEKPLEGAESKWVFRFPFVACEILSCDVDVIPKTLVEDEELMALLFSFLESDRPHRTVLAEYFSKIVMCLLLRRTVAMLHYIQTHQDLLAKFVNLIGITPMKEILIRLVGAEDNIYTYHSESLQWLADTNLLDMLVDALSLPDCPDVHQNSAETLCAISHVVPSALASKLSSPMFLERVFQNALNNFQSKSTLVHSLSVWTSVLDSRRHVLAASGSICTMMSESMNVTKADILNCMLQGIGQLMKFLYVCPDENVLPTTYGDLRPPFGIHRLKIVEYISAIVRNSNGSTRQELIHLGAINRIIDLLFEYPFNNILHHHVESIITTCLESKDAIVIDHILKDCDLVGKLIAADKDCFVTNSIKSLVTTSGKPLPRLGHMGHLTRIANKISRLSSSTVQIQAIQQANPEWQRWQMTVLQHRNAIENVLHWTCGHPSRIQAHHFNDNLSAMANDPSKAIRHGIFEDDVSGITDEDVENFENITFNDEPSDSVGSVLPIGEDEERSKLSESVLNAESQESQESPTFVVPLPTQSDSNTMNAGIVAPSTECSSAYKRILDSGFSDGLKQTTDSVEDLSVGLEMDGISDSKSLSECEHNINGLHAASDLSLKGCNMSEWHSEENRIKPTQTAKNSEYEMETGNIVSSSNLYPSNYGYAIDVDTKSNDEKGKRLSSISLPDEAEVEELRERIGFPLFVEKVEIVGVEV
eukprot:TRINITY_DN11708_c0_g1_i1.p1 TRINITY_DN11708_c0_g1~~TRINITY_DN11708_c0_g1_i1.p1  ORF type:complete len:764 (+),score=141.89 TRINITY_DN11708_c0_g1_i1:237-2528(+)